MDINQPKEKNGSREIRISQVMLAITNWANDAKQTNNKYENFLKYGVIRYE